MRKRFFLYLFLCLLSVSNTVFAGITFGSRNSALKFSSGSTFNVSSPALVLNVDGTIAKNSAANITGNNIQFTNGILESDGSEILMTAVFNPTAGNSIWLNGNGRFKAEPGQVLENIYVVGARNTLYGQPFFSNANAIRLQSDSSELTLAVQSDFNSTLELRGGRVRLGDSLRFLDDRNFTTSGNVNLQGHALTFGVDDLTLTHSIYWERATDINLSSKTSLSGTWTFSGVGTVNGHGNILDLTLGGTIFVARNSTLNLTDVVVKGVGIDKGWLLFQDHTSTISMSNVTLELDNRFTVTTGAIYVGGPTTYVLKNHNFSFDSLGTLSVDGITLWKDNAAYDSTGNEGDILFSDDASQKALINDGTISGFATDLGIKYNSNAIINLEEQVKDNSNAIVYGLNNNSNAILNLEDQVENNSNAIMWHDDQIRYNSNAIVNNDSLEDLIFDNSNTIIYLSDVLNTATYNIAYNSSAIVVLEEQVKDNSNAIVYGLNNNSNAILNLEDQVENNSNAIMWHDDQIRYNSNAIVNNDSLEDLIFDNSNTIIYLSDVLNTATYNIAYNSSAIVVLEEQVKDNSNAIVYGLNNNSNAILNLEDQVENNSNAIMWHDDQIRYNSNAIVNSDSGLAEWVAWNSSAIVVLEEQVKDNSNAIVYGLNNNSNAILNLEDQVENNSNAIMWHDDQIRYNSNAIVNNDSLEDLIFDNSNTIIYLSDVLNTATYNIAYNSSAIVVLEEQVKDNSNAIVYGLNNNSNAILNLEDQVENNSNAIMWHDDQIRYNSNAIVNSDSGLAEWVAWNSSAIVVLEEQVKDNSNAIVYGLNNNSNAILNLEDQVENNSNAIMWHDDQIRYNSNAIVNNDSLEDLIFDNSNTIIYLSDVLNTATYNIAYNSSAIVVLEEQVKDNSNAIVYGLNNNSNAILNLEDQVENNSNAIMWHDDQIRYNSNAIVNSDSGLAEWVAWNSSAIVVLEEQVKDNSNAIVYGLNNNSNAILNLEDQVENNSNAIMWHDDQIRYNSNAIVNNDSLEDLIFDNSNTIIYLSDVLNTATYNIAYNSSAIVVLEEQVKDNSNAIVYGLNNNSNAILNLEDQVENNSNAIMWHDDQIRYNSNAIVNSDSGLAEWVAWNSSAIVVLEEQVKDNSNAIVYGLNNNSNAILHLEEQAKDNSNAIVYGLNNNSNAILNLEDQVENNSNAIINDYAIKAVHEEYITANSNAILWQDEQIRWNSNAIQSGDFSTIVPFIRWNSSAIVNSDATALADWIRWNSSAILNSTAESAVTQKLLGPALTVDVVLDQSIFVHPDQKINVDGDITIDGQGAILIFADEERPQFIVRPGRTVTLKNIQLDRINQNTINVIYQSSAIAGSDLWNLTEGKIIIGENVIFGLNENITFSQGLIELGNNSVTGNPQTFRVRGVNGTKRFIINPSTEYRTAIERYTGIYNNGALRAHADRVKNIVGLYQYEPVLLKLAQNTLGVQATQLSGIQHISHDVGAIYAGAIGLIGEAAVDVGDTNYYLTSAQKEIRKEECDNIFQAQGLDNKLRLLKDDLKLTGQMLFGSTGENVVSVDTLLTERLEGTLASPVRPAILNLGTNFLDLTSRDRLNPHRSGFARLIFEDPEIRVNNDTNAFWVYENSYLSGERIEITGDAIHNGYDPASDSRPFILDVLQLVRYPESSNLPALISEFESTLGLELKSFEDEIFRTPHAKYLTALDLEAQLEQDEYENFFKPSAKTSNSKRPIISAGSVVNTRPAINNNLNKPAENIASKPRVRRSLEELQDLLEQDLFEIEDEDLILDEIEEELTRAIQPPAVDANIQSLINQTSVGFDSQGSINLDNATLTNFSVKESSAINLTLVSSSVIKLRSDVATIFKTGDVLNVQGKGNEIWVSNTFNMNGALCFEADSQLTIKLVTDDAKVLFGVSSVVDLESNVEWTTEGNGTVEFGNNSIINLKGSKAYPALYPSLIIKDRAKVTPASGASVKVKGVGNVIILDSGKLFAQAIDANKTWIFGNALTDQINLSVVGTGMIELSGSGDYKGRLSIQKTESNISFMQSGNLQIESGGWFEINSNNGTVASGKLISFDMENASNLYIFGTGKLTFANNAASSDFAWDSLRANIKGDGFVGFVSGTPASGYSNLGFTGKIQSDSSNVFFANTSISPLNLVRTFVNQNTSLTAAVQFTNESGQNTLRIKNGKQVAIVAGDSLQSEDSAGNVSGRTSIGDEVIYKTDGTRQVIPIRTAE